MPTWSKVVLALGAVVLVIGLAFAGARHWWHANRDRLKANALRLRAEGTAFGAKTDSEGCIAEGLKRVQERGGILDSVEHNLFLTACLGAARHPPGFCDNVPRPDEIMKSAMWANTECLRRLRTASQPCTGLMRTVSQSCWPDK